MKHLLIILLLSAFFFSGCAQVCEQILYHQTDSYKNGKSYYDYHREQRDQKEEAMRHESWHDHSQ